MKHYAKLVALLLTVLTALLIVTACRNGTPDTETQSSTEGVTGDVASETVAETRDPETFYFEDNVTEAEETEESEAATDAVYEYEQDFSKLLFADDKNWFKNSEADLSQGYLTSTTGHSYLSLKHKAKADTVYLSLDLKANRPGAFANDSAYIALRMPKYDDEFAAVGQNGVWLAFQGSRVGIVNTWPTVTLFDSGFDFTASRKVYVEDDQRRNVISVYVDENDQKQLVFQVKITDSKIVTVTDKNGATKITASFGYDIPSNGYMAVWAHQNNGQVVFDNIEVRWEEKARATYVPTDPDTLRDLYGDTWVGIDDEDRFINYGADDVDAKMVGMFYQIWHIQTTTFYPNQILYDHYQLYLDGGHAAVKDAYTKGPEGWGHYWAQPYFGYYLTNDRWVIRKHASMLTDIGVDFIYMDVTNGNPLTTSYMAILKEYKAMREEGLKTPNICFFLADNAELNPRVFEDIWDNVYSTGQYRDLYAMYQGKPLILGNMKYVENKEALETFTVRRCWALRETLAKDKTMWSWMCESPQRPSSDAAGEIEEISISAAILANTSSGRSNVKNRQPKLVTLPDGTLDIFQFELPTTGQGLFFAEQMAQAKKYDPYVLLINAWNEWGAGRWETTGHNTIANTFIDWSNSIYVDCFNPEFSRDIEPMAGGFGDNYYYQLAQFLREFKGSRTAPEAAGQTDIGLKADLSAWSGVWPEYMDANADTFHRDAMGFCNFFHYTNESGRNDIVSAKVSKTDAATYFLAVCADTITAPEGSNWMNLFINTDCDYTTGWYGYDIVINRDGAKAAAGKVTVEKFVDNEWKFQSIGEGEIAVSGNYLVIKVDTALCGLGKDFDFKWADNSTTEGKIMQFLDQGDAAPNARFNYAYRAEAAAAPFNETVDSFLANGGAAFGTGKSYMAVEDRVARLYDGNTAATAKMYQGRMFAPVTALSNLNGTAVTISSDGKTASWTYNGKTLVFTDGVAEVKVGIDTCYIPVAPFVENGVLYVPLNAVAFLLDLNYYTNGDVAILSPKADFPEGKAAERLYEALERSF